MNTFRSKGINECWSGINSTVWPQKLHITFYTIIQLQNHKFLYDLRFLYLLHHAISLT